MNDFIHPWTLPIQAATQAILCNFSHTLFLPLPTHLALHHISKGGHPIIQTLTLQMSKSPQSAMHHHNLNPQNTVQIHTVPSVLQRHSTHPSHHPMLRLLQTMQIFSLHCPCLSPISLPALDTCSVYLPLYMMHQRLSRWKITPWT